MCLLPRFSPQAAPQRRYSFQQLGLFPWLPPRVGLQRPLPLLKSSFLCLASKCKITFFIRCCREGSPYMVISATFPEPPVSTVIQIEPSYHSDGTEGWIRPKQVKSRKQEEGAGLAGLDGEIGLENGGRTCCPSRLHTGNKPTPLSGETHQKPFRPPRSPCGARQAHRFRPEAARTQVECEASGRKGPPSVFSARGGRH